VTEAAVASEAREIVPEPAEAPASLPGVTGEPTDAGATDGETAHADAGADTEVTAITWVTHGGDRHAPGESFRCDRATAVALELDRAIHPLPRAGT
jgi:hypothetical protein